MLLKTITLIFLSIIKLPILLFQAIHTRRTTIRLPDAEGKNQGRQLGNKLTQKSKSTAATLCIIGESTVAGVGTDKLENAIGARTANSLSNLLGGPVAWSSHGVNGIRIKGILDEVIPQVIRSYSNLMKKNKAAKTRIFLVCIGANDTTKLTSIRKWRWRLAELVLALSRLDSHAKIIFTSVPPMHKFSALPQPLRFMIGQRAKQLQKALEEHHFANRYFLVMPALFSSVKEGLAEDGYHPSTSGYAEWGQVNAEYVMKLLQNDNAV